MAGIIGDGIIYKDKTSEVLDLNSILSQSTYLVYTSNPNTPNGMDAYGWVTTMPAFDSQSYSTQFLLDRRGAFFVRVKNSKTWLEWNKVTTTPL